MNKAPNNQIARRNMLRLSIAGASSFSIANVLRGREHSLASKTNTETSVVWLWLQGGAPHIETFDPKMTAPSNYRSMVGAQSTAIPGVEFGGQIPKMAALADKLSVVRSFQHTNGDHLGASHYVLTATDAPGGAKKQLAPSFGSITSKVRGPAHKTTGVPTFTRVSRTVSFDFDQPLWLGGEFAPFDISGPARSNLNLNVDVDRIGSRQRLRSSLDTIRRRLDQSGAMDATDKFQQQAVDLVLGNAKDAFDTTREDAQTKAAYGPGLGEQLLSARRLCEAGCGFVMLNYGWAPTPSETPFAWDMHLGPSQPNAPAMKGQLESIFPMFDHAISAFLTDVEQRGLSENILLVVTGDFGRTPKINRAAGRDHYPNCYSVAFAGGGIRGGQVYGKSDWMGAEPAEAPCAPPDLHATIFHALGIDGATTIHDLDGRPLTLTDGKPLPLF